MAPADPEPPALLAASRWELLDALVKALPWPLRIEDSSGNVVLTNELFDALRADQRMPGEGRLDLVLADGSRYVAEFFSQRTERDSEVDSRISQTPLSLVPNAPQPAHLLVVDDDDDHRRLVTQMLERAGYTVTQSPAAGDALRLLERQSFDALISDIAMPGMDGLNLVTGLRRLEADQDRPRIPAVIVTAHNLQDYQSRAQRAGVDAFLAKPLRARQLCSAISKLLKEPPKILVVDDHEESRLIVERYLGDLAMPVSVYTTDSGKGALELCANQQFSLITLDVVMPELDGVQTARILRALPGYEKVPMIACSARLGDKEITALERAGCNATLSKPLDKGALLRVVEPFLLMPRTPRDMRQDVRPREAPSKPRHVVAVPADIFDLVPIFLENRARDASTLRQLTQERRFDEVARLAHGMIGTGSAYGFPYVTELGSRMESCAEEEQAEEILALCKSLVDYLASVEAIGSD